MTRLKTMIASTVLLTALAAFAHGGGEHIKGTVERVEMDSLTVKTIEGKRVAIHYDAQTEFEKSGAAAKATDLKPGERVVVHAMVMNGVLHAHVVKFGKTSRSAADGGTPAPDASDAGTTTKEHPHGHKAN